MEPSEVIDSTEASTEASSGAQPAHAHGRRNLVVGAAALAAAALVVGAVFGSHAGSGGASPGAPRPLAIGLPNSFATDSILRSSYPSPYRLTGTLPAVPARAPIQLLIDDAIDRSRVAALAAALGLTGDPKQQGHDWTVTSGGDQLTIYSFSGHPWVFARRDARACPPLPLNGFDGPSTAVGCAVASPDGGYPSAPLKPLSTQATATVAQPVLAATGLTYAGVRVDFGTLFADPVVAGFRTSGLATVITSDIGGIRTATGWLPTTRAGDIYPLRTAQAVFDALAAEPQPLAAVARPCPAPSTKTSVPSCGGIPVPLNVTGAELGYSLAWEDAKPLLVPAWLFDVEATTKGGDPSTFARIAVALQFLAPSSAPTEQPGGQSGGGSGVAIPPVKTP